MHTELRLASIFSDHMVLCRDKVIRIFGEAESGREITIHLHDHTASCKAVKNKFDAAFPPMPAGGPYMLTVTDGEQTRAYTDVLIGDVYFAGGQSNMEMRLEHSADSAHYLAQAEYPSIRYCIFPVQGILDEETLRKERETRWKTVRPNTCGEISAAAFHFAVKLQTEIHVPVGIIGCYLGGSPILCWMDEQAASVTTGGKEILEAYQLRIKDKPDDEFDRETADFWVRNQAWSRGAEAMKKKDPTVNWDDFIRELGPCPWPPPEGRKAPLRPCGLAETMVKRIAPYTIAGFLYYQGESDFRHPHLYRALMTTLISHWRDLFLDSSLPFFFVQLPMFNQRDDETRESWALLRQAQEQTYQDMRNTGLAVMIDGGEQEDVHPRDKKTVGERLCLQALKVLYHAEEAVCDSPRAVSARPEGNAMLVQVSAALRNSVNPGLFEVAGDDGEFYPATAELSATAIRVSSPSVNRPRSVRYAWVNYGSVDVFGVNGLPLAPFSLR